MASNCKLHIAHLSLDFTSQEFGTEPNVSTTIQSSSSVAIQNRGDAHCIATDDDDCIVVETFGTIQILG